MFELFNDFKTRLTQKLKKVIDWFYCFLERAFPAPAPSPFSSEAQSFDFFESGRTDRRKTKKTLDFYPEDEKEHVQLQIEEADHGEIPSYLIRDVPVEDLDTAQTNTKESELTDPASTKGWAQKLSEEIFKIEGVRVIVDPFNSYYYYPFGDLSKTKYPFSDKASDHYTVCGLLKNRIKPILEGIPISIVRPKTQTSLTVEFEDNDLYLIRDMDRIRIFKHNSNTTRVLGMTLKKYRESIKS